MADTIRVKSTLPVAIRIAEPHPNPDRPGDSPALAQGIINPGVNDGVDAKLFRAWADASGKDFLASAEDVRAGNAQGKIYEMTDDEPAEEFGFEPALKRAVDAAGSVAAEGSTQTDLPPIKAEDMKTGSAEAAPAPVLTASAPLKVPVTNEPEGAKSGFAKVAPELPEAK